MNEEISYQDIIEDKRRKSAHILKTVLENHECEKTFVELMFKKAKRIAPFKLILPDELFDDIITFKSGYNDIEKAKMIAEEYKIFLNNI